MKTILVMNQKGGVSKTSCCVELCNFLCQFKHDKNGSNVLAIDLDAQQHLSKYCGSSILLSEQNELGKIIEKSNILDVLLGEQYILDVIQTVQVPKFLNKVAIAKAIAERKSSLANKKKEIKESEIIKSEASRLCRAEDYKAKTEINKIKKQILEEEYDSPSFDLLPASKKLSNSAKIFTEIDDVYILKEILSDEEVQNKYDYCVIDSAPARSPLLNQSLVAADYIIIPTDRDMGGLDGILNTLADIENFKKRNMTNAKVLGVFLTRLEKQIIQAEIESYIEETAIENNIPVFNSHTKNSSLAKESRLMSQSIGEYKPNSSLAFEYYAFAKEVMEKIEGDK